LSLFHLTLGLNLLFLDSRSGSGLLTLDSGDSSFALGISSGDGILAIAVTINLFSLRRGSTSLCFSSIQDLGKLSRVGITTSVDFHVTDLDANRLLIRLVFRDESIELRECIIELTVPHERHLFEADCRGNLDCHGDSGVEQNAHCVYYW